jgi:2-oxoisovalerate dehydrogenase E1 component alpha subunit
LVFICENNRYAISVPKSRQMAIDDLASRAAGYGFPGFTIDGMDLIQCYEAVRQAIKHARSQGPVLLEMNLERFMPHTTDDDDRRYRPETEVQQARQRDPVLTLESLLVAQGAITPERVEEIKAQARRAVNEATDAAEAAGAPDVSTLHHLVFSP